MELSVVDLIVRLGYDIDHSLRDLNCSSDVLDIVVVVRNVISVSVKNLYCKLIGQRRFRNVLE